MKNSKIILLAILISMSSFLYSFASMDNTSSELPNYLDQKILVIDSANIIDDSVEAELLNKAESISNKYKMDIAIITTSQSGINDIVSFTENTYKNFNYGQGSNKDGMLLLLSTQERDYSLFKNGKPYKALKDVYWEDYILQPTLSELGDDRYEKAFTVFLSKTDEVFANMNDDGTLPKQPKNILMYIIGIIGSFLSSLGIVQVGKSSLKSVSFNRSADNYVKPNSLNLTESYDNFLYRNVTRVRREKQQSSSTRSSSSGSSGSTSGKY